LAHQFVAESGRIDNASEGGFTGLHNLLYLFKLFVLVKSSTAVIPDFAKSAKFAASVILGAPVII